MSKIGVLGPKGTFSEVACRKYCDYFNLKDELCYYPSISQVSKSLIENHKIILPIENTLDGYVTETIDFLLNNNFKIFCDVFTKVDFSFVANNQEFEHITDIFVQFKAKGQCLNFLNQHSFKVHQTQSNIESLELLKESANNFGAIVPRHTLTDNQFEMTLPDVTDSKANYTRFIVVTDANDSKFHSEKIKCSVCVEALVDKPGILVNLLQQFERYNINLGGIMSRPTKIEMGKYNFFIEFIACQKDIGKIQQLFKEIEKNHDFRIKLLGLYSSIE